MNNIQETTNRWFNLLATSIVGLAGLSFLPEAFVEKDLPDKIDDALLFILGVIAVIWYNKSNNRYTRSIIPVVFVLLALVVKLIGLWIELDDPEAFGDDIGGVILLVSSSILVIRQYMKSKEVVLGASVG